jgi:UDP-glucuronate decarboxylase
MNRVLVTGGAGFIGSHLCQRLLARGDEVLCVDNFFTSRRQNIAHLFGNPNFEFMRHDITWPLYVEVDQIYNLACPASPVHYQFDPVQTTKTSVHGAINMLGLAKRLKVRILQASTSEVYGDPAEHPQTESYWGNVNPIGPRACYDAETEILTEDGWVPFPSLRQDTAVATLTEAGEIEYHVPDEVISFPYVGELLRFANSKFDFAVTPNHRMYVRSKTGKMRFLRADEDRYWNAWKVPTGADFKGGEIEGFELGTPPPDAKIQVARIRMDDWLEFLGYYISEGCVHVRQRVREVNGRDYEVRDYNVLIAQAEGDSRDCMIACLDRLGFKYFTSDDHQLRICSKQLAEILAPFGKAGDKYIPREFLGLSRRQSTILLDALILGDGSRRGDSVCYWTKSGRLADDVQELALRCGYAASKSLTPGRDIYRVNLRPPVEANLVEPERIRYAGKVYCVDVKNHVICVRRHGRAAFCGNCYDEGKRCAETLFFDYYRQHKLQIRVVRIFNTYGPRMHPNDGRVVSNFIVQSLKGEPITLYGTGSQSRSFCYVDDLVIGMIAMMDQDELVGPVNLGNPGEFTILELATMVKELTGSKSEIVFQPLPQDDPVRRRPDITLAKAKLRWEPTIPLRDGLTRTVAFFRELLAAGK